jgi:perosamine synthetase
VIPLSAPEIGGNAWAYVKDCLDSGWVSSAGAYVDRFEEALARHVGVSHAVACVNGTAALHIALLVAGVEAGDEVIVPSLTFIAPANAVRYVGAVPVFADVDQLYWQLDARSVQHFLEASCDVVDGRCRNRVTGRRVKAVIPVDLLGHPADVDAIAEVAKANGLAVVEDATESLGALYRGCSVGKHADVACFSFNGNKTITAGGGGMIATDNAAYARRARYLTTQAKDDPIEYVHNEVGYNYRLTNLAAALGLAQLEQLDEFVARKRAIAARYAESLARVPGVRVMAEAPWAASTFWLYTPLIDAAVYGRDSRALINDLWRERIQARPLWQPLHASPAHAGSPVVGSDVAARVAEQAISLPSSVGLSALQQDRVTAAIRALAS